MTTLTAPATAVTASILEGKPTLMRFPHLVQNPPRKIAPELGMLGGAAAAAGQVVDTYDWDTVFAIKFADVNTELAKPGSRQPASPRPIPALPHLVTSAPGSSAAAMACCCT